MPQLVRPADLINKYYAQHEVARQILLEHSRQVTRRALKIARNFIANEPLDLQFIAEAAMLHDIGMIMTNTPELDCHGSGSYLRHGIAGREILEKEGLPKHALVCERHIGIGLTAEEIRTQELPLPQRDMLPLTLEEQIICYADLFYSKNENKRGKEKTVAMVRKSIGRFGEEKLIVFEEWRKRFEPELG
ncbi:HD domain-containing protein [Malonomonas rubra]|uniref:HD domain-containing protein n=1 Tax=Malonomonas rubra TaxID=57040 RepID=UPI0026E9B115|nr:HD domain-containing protein [Malonomonas rubra]